MRDSVVLMPVHEDFARITVIPADSSVLPNCSISHLIPTSYFAHTFVILGWFAVVLLGTVFPRSLLGSFSIRRSIAELTAGRHSRLDVLDVFRVVAIVWVMINHTGSEGRIDILERKPSAELFKKNVHEHPIFGALLGNSALGVEIFLVLSGLLAARSWLRQADQPFKEHYINFILKRILRLFPSVAAFIFIAAGPLMKDLLPRYHNTIISACGVSGILSHLTFTGNWQSTPTCMGYLWYLGLDMQLYIMAPFLLHMLYKHPRRATLIFGLIMAVSCYMRAAYCTAYGVCNKSDVDIPFISYPDSDPATLAKIYGGLWEMYARPYTKCGPFLLGLLTGYFSVYYDKITLGPRSSRLLFSTSAVLAVGTIYAILPEYWYPEQGDNTYNMLYTAIFRTVFATATIGMIIATVYTEKSPVISSIWAILGRLTFNAYLLHMPIIYIFNHLSFLQTAEGAYELLAVVPFVFVLSFAASAVFYVMFESPLGNLSCQIARSKGF